MTKDEAWLMLTRLHAETRRGQILTILSIIENLL